MINIICLMENKEENNGLSGREKAIAFMLRKNKPGIAKRKPKPELIIGVQSEEGIFLGRWQPKDREGNSLEKIFNVFAAPQDLPDTMKYKDTIKHIANLKDWHGFDGASYANDKELYKALKDDSYDGGWIIPPRELLAGTEADGELGIIRKGKVIQPDNLFDHQNKGEFKGAFKTAAASGSDCPGWYWSSTEYRDSPLNVLGIQLSDGGGGWVCKDIVRLSCRPVRLVEASASLSMPR